MVGLNMNLVKRQVQHNILAAVSGSGSVSRLLSNPLYNVQKVRLNLPGWW
jgi:hypothetical protein